MTTFREIKDHYRFSESEIETLRELLPVVEPYMNQITDDFYNFLREMPGTAQFLADETLLVRLRQAHQGWLLDLFQGSFDERYFKRLQRIGHAHVRIGLSAHFVYVAMNFIRDRLRRVIEAEVDPDLQPPALRAVDKILDLNLDVIARTYHEEELRRVFLTFKLDDAVIRFAHRFTFGLNMTLVIGLLGLSVGAVVMIIKDVINVFTSQFEKALLGALGSLLILWLVIELLEAEIERLRGGAFKLHLFVGVGLVAFIREELISSIAHKDITLQALYIGGILVLGFIYWLLSRSEVQR
ncbi:MAG: phosphate-starvation-inducible PsiE family protein [Deltaproteobacteria bacterium]|nr:phosphate-starvation-inducible PsiE family protein [Deltaproteobacteria bacterium]MBW1953406.1 phosphate-starvation-inducible PsiE family protein [Deltaproteobacteria bacterium]